MTIGFKALAALLLGVTSVTLATEPPAARPDDKSKPAAEKVPAFPLVGVYTLVSGEKAGQPIPEDRIKGSLIAFTTEKIVGTDKDKKEFFAATYTLDTTKTPWVIKMKSTSPKEAEAPGLVKRDGDTVTIIYALPGGDAPTEFKTRDKQHLFVIKAVPSTNKPVPTEKPKP